MSEGYFTIGDVIYYKSIDDCGEYVQLQGTYEDFTEAELIRMGLQPKCHG